MAKEKLITTVRNIYRNNIRIKRKKTTIKNRMRRKIFQVTKKGNFAVYDLDMAKKGKLKAKNKTESRLITDRNNATKTNYINVRIDHMKKYKLCVMTEI